MHIFSQVYTPYLLLLPPHLQIPTQIKFAFYHHIDLKNSNTKRDTFYPHSSSWPNMH